MKRIPNLLACLLLLSFAQSGIAQAIAKSGISADNYYGFHVMQGYGFFLCYEKSGKLAVELYDQEASLSHMAELKMKVKMEKLPQFSGLYNQSSFLIFKTQFYGFGKKECVVTAFDGQFKQTAQLEVDGDFVDAFVIDEGHYGFLLKNGGKNYLNILDNQLKQVSSTAFGDSHRLMPQTYATSPDRSVTSAMKGTELPADDPLFFTIGVDYKVLTYAGCKVFAFDKNGKLRFEYVLDHERVVPYCGYVRDGKAYVVVREGEIPDNMLDTASYQLTTYVLDSGGKLLQKIPHDIVLKSIMVYPLSIMVEEGGTVITRGVSTYEGPYDPLSAGMANPNRGSLVEFLYFDKEANLLGAQQFTSMEKGQAREGHKFFHTSQLVEEELVYGVYSNLDKQTLSIYASIGTKKDALVITTPWEGTDAENFMMGRICVYPAGPGKVVAGFYDAKKMTFTAYKKRVEFGK
ncbi:MAG: hypothetical protein IT258_23410 [Saprospiraceae bacterium]|nr:hypothetical protein [Saprospiraceae bacterium]